MTSVSKNRLKGMAQLMGYALTIASFMSLLGGVAILLFGDLMTSVMGRISGADAIATEVRAGFATTGVQLDTTNARLEDLAVKVASNTSEIRALRPITVAEYDANRSRIYSPCYFGVPCESQYRVRRTQYGLQCGTPNVISRTVIDSAGQYHSVEPAAGNRIRRVNGEWSVIVPAFFVPEHAPVGIAEFYMLLEYDCDDPEDPGQTIRIEQETLRLLFEIAEAPQTP